MSDTNKQDDFVRKAKPYDGSGPPKGINPTKDSKTSIKVTAGNLLSRAADGLKNMAGKLAFGTLAAGKALAGSVGNGLGKAKDNILHAGGVMVTNFSNSVHISKKAATVSLVGILAASSVTGLSFYNDWRRSELLLRQELPVDDCAEEVDKKKASAFEGDLDAQWLENASKLWAVGQVIGMSDASIAGWLGNMQIESHLDPTIFEGMTATYVWDDRRQAAMADINSYTHSIGKFGGGYTDSSTGEDLCGIGLAQWTGPLNTELRDFADAIGYDWWELDAQVIYMLAPTGYYRTKQVAAQSDYTDPREAAHDYLLLWEGCNPPENDLNLSNRQDEAERIMGLYESGQIVPDTAYANSMVELAGSLLAGGANKKYKDGAKECKKAEQPVDNSDMANAAVAYAWSSRAESFNEGTVCYQKVHDAIWGAGDIRKSCDRGVTTAVQWCGADVSIPAGDTSALETYFSTSPKWERIGLYNGDESTLKPGDVACRGNGLRGHATGHVMMYVGNEAVRKKFPDSNATWVSASYGSRSPACHEQDSSAGDGSYYIFRLKTSDKSPKWDSLTCSRSECG